MSAVLATLQSDQYEAITRPVADNQVLQGHPGTGKTIVAAHRAAYFLTREAAPLGADSLRGRVLILGPTEDYVEHVRGALDSLVGDSTNYEVTALPLLLNRFAEISDSSILSDMGDWRDSSREVAELVDLAYARAKRATGSGARPAFGDVYDALTGLSDDLPAQGLDRPWFDYLKALPRSLRDMRNGRPSKYRGLLAYIGVRTRSPSNPGHVIVDEAQDITGIEWEILGRLGNRGGWTILGDLNQRRNDFTFDSWDEVAEVIAIEANDGHAPVTTLERGYRSTAQIIHFANQLLPARERHLHSLQTDGEAPRIIRADSASNAFDVAHNAATVLLDKVGTGTVAIISVASTQVGQFLVKRGWVAASGDRTTWRKDELVLRVLQPERARGLEFDGVVVIEPSDFPENIGRQGVLYTALTRANRFLCVVHFKPLPRGLKARG